MNDALRTVSCVAVAVSLTACSSGSSGPGPVYAPPGPISSNDYIGKTFPVRYFGYDNVIPTRPFRGTGTIEILAGDEVVLTIDGQTYSLVDTAPVDGEFTDGSVSVDFNSFSNSTSGFDNGGTSYLFLGAFGFETDPSDMPTTSGASYSSTGTSTVLLYQPFAYQRRTGDVSLSASFAPGGGTITGQIFNDGSIVMFLSGGTISGNTIDGMVTMTYDDGGPGGAIPIGVMNSDVDGWFYGNPAQNIAATFEGDFATSVAGFDAFVGGFLAD